MKSLLISLKDGVRLIKLNKQQRKNAMDPDMYAEITRILNTDADNDDVVVTIFTGCGSYFSSGNDLKEVMNVVSTSSYSEEKLSSVKYMTEAFINYPKLLIAVVNGPAIGIGATMAGLCDVIYASDKATFQTPFVKLGLCTEACSSYIFPNVMGKGKATEMLLLNHTMNAEEAYQFRFISQVIPHDKLDEFIVKLHEFGKLPVKSIVINKRLIRENCKNILLECNERESRQIMECLSSEDFLNAVLKFASKKSKL